MSERDIPPCRNFVRDIFVLAETKGAVADQFTEADQYLCIVSHEHQ